MNATTDNPYLTAALAAYEAGFSVLPPEQDGSKKPLAGAWRRFQTKRASLELIHSWYENGRTGVGAVMGDISGNVELFEFDDGAAFIAFMEAARATGLGGVVERIRLGYSERTPGGGIHWYYRCSTIGASKKLARRFKREDERQHEQDNYKVLIETKGIGGYAIMAPSDGTVHPSRGAYERLAGSLATIAEITPEERTALWQLAQSFDETGRNEEDQPVRLPHPKNGSGGRPGDDFIARTNWHAILEPKGWKPVYQHGGATYWRRPGKDYGISATTNYQGSDLLYVFTTSTAFEAERAYNRFTAYAILAHQGDFTAAAKELRRQGYGGTPATALLDDLAPRKDAADSSASPSSAAEEERPGTYRIIDIVDYKNKPRPRWQVEDIIQEETFVCVYGPPGTYKTFFVLDLALSLACGQTFQGKRTKPGKILYILAEGQGGFGMRVAAWELGRGITIDRNIGGVIDQAVPLHDIEAVSKMVAAADDIDFSPSVIVFDTLSQNLVGADENSSEAMTNAVNAANQLRKRFKCTVIVVHHGRKSDGALRGHSSLLGALNTVIRLTTNDEAEARGDDRVIEVWVEKQKDGEQHYTLFYLKPQAVELPSAPDDDLPEDDIIVPVATSSVVLNRVTETEDKTLRATQGERRKPPQLKGFAREYGTVLYQSFGLLGATDTEWREAAVKAELLDRASSTSRQRYQDARASLLRDRFVRTERRDETDWYYATQSLEQRLRKDGRIA